jgi:hypothetical protein
MIMFLMMGVCGEFAMTLGLITSANRTIVV